MFIQSYDGNRSAGHPSSAADLLCRRFADQRNSFRFAPTGIRTEALLEALKIEYEVIVNSHDLETKTRDAVRMMHALKQPVALLFTGDFTT